MTRLELHKAIEPATGPLSSIKRSSHYAQHSRCTTDGTQSISLFGKRIRQAASLSWLQRTVRETVQKSEDGGNDTLPPSKLESGFLQGSRFLCFPSRRCFHTQDGMQPSAMPIRFLVIIKRERKVKHSITLAQKKNLWEWYWVLVLNLILDVSFWETTWGARHFSSQLLQCLKLLLSSGLPLPTQQNKSEETVIFYTDKIGH